MKIIVFIVGFFLGIAIHDATHAMTLSKKDRAFLGGAATVVILGKAMKGYHDDDREWNHGWYEGYREPPRYNHYGSTLPPRRPRKEDHCPTVTWCTREFRDFSERNACIRGVNDCVEEATRIDWDRVHDAYYSGRGR